MEALPITALYAGILGLWLVILSSGVVRARLALQQSLGDGGHDELHVAQRRQGNFIEYVPLAVILIGLVELCGYPAWVVHALGATLVAARIAHPFGLAVEFGLRAPRFLGATATWIVLTVASLLAIASYVTA